MEPVTPMDGKIVQTSRSLATSILKSVAVPLLELVYPRLTHLSGLKPLLQFYYMPLYHSQFDLSVRQAGVEQA